jgi:hypothetical protein
LVDLLVAVPRDENVSPALWPSLVLPVLRPMPAG